ncbi:MAG: hypothetical protein QOD76_1511 [Solirubrobacteraceae bacterium]|jgi:ubiquinone/menaquinone biosynthesis C-methylase UbiE|nr:hypothetical protein [Solirubrobacteraceae bacterium]
MSPRIRTFPHRLRIRNLGKRHRRPTAGRAREHRKASKRVLDVGCGPALDALDIAASSSGFIVLTAYPELGK